MVLVDVLGEQLGCWVLLFVLGSGGGKLIELIAGLADSGFELRIIWLLCLAASEVVHVCEVFPILVALMRQHVLEVDAESILDGRLLRRKRHVLGRHPGGTRGM